MTLPNGVEIFTQSDIERMVPTTRNVNLLPEYAHNNTRLLTLHASTDDLMEMGLNAADNYSLLFALNEAVTACPGIGVDLFRPALETGAVSATHMFMKTPLGLGKAMRHETGYAGFETFPYTPQTDDRSIFPRDMVLVSSSGSSEGQKELVISEPLAKENHTRYTFAVSASRQSHMPAKKLPIFIEGGNLIVAKDHVFTLSDTLRKNGIDDSDSLVMQNLHSANGDIHLGKDVVVLDHDLGEKDQRVFHLDMLMNVVRGSDGQEVPRKGVGPLLIDCPDEFHSCGIPMETTIGKNLPSCTAIRIRTGDLRLEKASS